MIRHDGTDLQSIYFDFLELAVGVDSTPVIGGKERYTLATDWDTDHSIALPPERTAKMLKLLGFDGRANHYIGALWFYELCAPEHRYAVKKVRFEGQPRVNDIITMQLAGNVIEHLVHPGDTSTTVARAFALRLNQGYTAVWAEASGDELFVQARMMGCIGNSSSLLVTGGGSGFATSVETVQDGIDPVWRTDLNAQPRMNRAARDWTRAYVRALKSYGLAATCAFSMEIQHGDPSLAAGIAQRYPSGNPVQLLTPAIQTNFSPASIAFWRDVYADCAQLMTEAGVAPYLQFGEVQWWYFPYDGSGMPFYDGYTDQTFRELYGRAARRILNEHADPSGYQEEVSFYRSLVGQFTSEVMQYVRAFHPTCQFEVLYPTDVNESALNREVNFASQHWTASRLDCLKTESFTYTSRRDLNRARSSILFGEEVGFPWQQRSHLVGIADPTTPWSKEAAESTAAGVESVVLFALDQYCLIGYSESEMRGEPRSVYFGPS
ncbi:MAG: hypothetical protein NTY38_13355 [Acidobacteria bacterium]|nr:hypothetical protein [Acidobacteriota bacterium]